jgi:hypothetical protein
MFISERNMGNAVIWTTFAVMNDPHRLKANTDMQVDLNNHWVLQK